MNGFKLILSTVLAISALTGCSKDKDDKGDKNGALNEIRSLFEQQNSIKVTNEFGEPIIGADVLIGLSGSLIQTAADGTFQIPASWDSEQAVTISAKGYVRATYLARLPVVQNFVVRTAATAPLELTGQNSGFQVVNGDGKVDFSFVMPTMKNEDILHFDINMIISPESDIISAAGRELEIPSNVTLPKQRESYFIGITLEKPKYRVYFNTPGHKNIYASRGQFPMKKVVDELRSGKKFYELANYFSIQGGSVRETNVISATQNLDLPVTDMTFTQKMNVNSRQIKADEILLGAALGDYKGELFPSDVKNMKPGAATALNVMGAAPKVLSVLQRKSEADAGIGTSRLSAVIMDFQDGVSPQHYALQENPRLMSAYSIQVQKVPSLKNVNELATYATLSKVKKTVKEDVTYETLTTVWEVYAPKWVAQIDIPAWPGESAPSGGMRWSVALAGTTETSKVDQGLDLGPTVLQAITHVTKASTDF